LIGEFLSLPVFTFVYLKRLGDLSGQYFKVL